MELHNSKSSLFYSIMFDEKSAHIKITSKHLISQKQLFLCVESSTVAFTHNWRFHVQIPNISWSDFDT